MSSQKRKASHPDIKQYFCSKAKEDVSVVSQPKKANICSISSKNNFSAVQEEQHSTVSEGNDSKKSIQLSVSASGQSKKAFSNVTFQSWIKLKGFDESLNMNVFTLHVDGGIICLLCSKHPVVNTGRGKNCNVFTTEPEGLNGQASWITISALINTKMQLAWKKINVPRCFIVCIKIALQIKLAQLLSECT